MNVIFTEREFALLQNVSFTQTTKEPKHFKERRVEKGSEKEGFWGGSSNESVDSSVSSKVSRQERKDKVQLIQMLM